QIDYNRRLHLITLCISLLIAVITYPLLVFTSYRLLTSRFTSPIYQLIIINSFLGVFQIVVHILTRHLPAFYECFVIYDFLQQQRLEWISCFFMVFSYIVRLHCTFLIAVNRFFRFRSGSNRWLRNDRFFRLSLVSNLILPLIFALPTPLFGDFHYMQMSMTDGRSVFFAQLPLANLVRAQNTVSFS
ncbi:hypothetical protein PENTCL1PPCAC_14085, partial [Pristionchus entomophagus]